MKTIGIIGNGFVGKATYQLKCDEIDILYTEKCNYCYIALKNGILTSSFEGSYSTLISSQIGGNYGKKIYVDQVIKFALSEVIEKPSDTIIYKLPITFYKGFYEFRSTRVQKRMV